MDPITHLTLGACTGELLLGRRFGKKAMFFGALAANLPDIDTVFGLFEPGDQALLLHRGFTHSICFALLAGLLLAWLFHKWFSNIRFGAFIMFFCAELGLHDLLDTCTGYGTGLLEPFTHSRFSFNLLFVADPLFTIGLLVATVVLLFTNRSRKKWAAGGITVSLLYVCSALLCKSRLDPAATMTTPAPFNTLLWYNIKKTDSGYYTGYQSVFDKRPVSYTYHAQNKYLLKQSAPYLERFANGYYTVSVSGGHTYFNVIRFGQVQGWQTKDAPFVLSYPMDDTGNENMIIQKGRLAGWSRRSIKQYLERIMGR
ncbi:inner membrane protein [Mucilaginibacter pineti]|uniref:Inner membrane protein n=1 Tax=Mucilaginibacter pineti TaxID=1391627 RepID=A0A1G6Z578_9SPHI|nr:metal-dependent hydrolase [Mucilaginibacter pineti]SDD97770.1 inner membrane protein [Mucilaginibacter pineti]